MSLDSALSIASGGLANINAQFALISQNVANAATPGYATELSSQEAMTADGVGVGVRAGPARLQIDQALQTSLTQQNALVSNATTTQTALQAIDSVLGTPGSGGDLGSLLGNLGDSFSTLLTAPSNQTQQSAVVASATTLAQGINTLSAAYTQQRQAAQNGIGSALSTLNSTLSDIGQISNQIIALKPTNQTTADLENQRNSAVQSLSQLLDIKTVEQPNGDLQIYTATGMSLPTRDGSNPFTIANASTLPGSYYPGGGLPGITLDGSDVTSQMSGGQIGADVTLRDTTLPTGQGELDEFAYGVASRFAAQGLTLFTDPQGNVPAAGGTPAQSGYVGFSSTIQVNAAVAADPSLVRDGTKHDRRQPHRSRCFHAEPRRRAGRLHHADLQHRQLCARHPGPKRREPNAIEHQRPRRRRHPERTVQRRRCPVGLRHRPGFLPGPAKCHRNQQPGDGAGIADQPQHQGRLGQRSQHGHRDVADAQSAKRLQRQRPRDQRGARDVHSAPPGRAVSSSVSAGGFGIINTLIANSTNVHQQLDKLTEQVSTGLIAQTYAGLGDGAATSLNLSPQINALQTYQSNINQATGTMQVAQGALTQIQQIASTFVADIPNLNGLFPSEVDSVASNARSALAQLTNLLDTKDGNVYVFGGQDTTNPPIPTPDAILTSGFYTQINAAVSALPANGAAATVASTLAIASSNAAGTSPFSAYMSQPASAIGTQVVQTGEDSTVQTGLLASGNSVATSTGTSTTGSYMRDLMRALATLGSMSSSQVNDPGFAGLIQDTGASLNDLTTAMSTDIGILGTNQSNLTTVQTQLTATSTALSNQVSSAQDVDMAATLSAMTNTQTQLQASYRLITGETSLSLVNFLPATA